MKIWWILLCLGLAGGSTTALAIEEPAYEPAGRVDKVEFRDYAPSIQARIPAAPGNRSSGGFRRLVNYIFGDNAAGQSIAMTAPVETRMTADGYMAFTMPSEYAMEELPAPDDKDVSLHEVPARRMAVISFSGWATDGRVKRITRELLDTLEANEIKTVGPPSLNQYDPPWTPPWSRRNEVVIQVEHLPTRLQ